LQFLRFLYTHSVQFLKLKLGDGYMNKQCTSTTNKAIFEQCTNLKLSGPWRRRGRCRAGGQAAIARRRQRPAARAPKGARAGKGHGGDGVADGPAAHAPAQGKMAGSMRWEGAGVRERVGRRRGAGARAGVGRRRGASRRGAGPARSRTGKKWEIGLQARDRVSHWSSLLILGLYFMEVGL
jgi:hypothetical protein